MKIKFGVKEESPDCVPCGPSKSSKPVVRFPTICFSGKHKELFEKALGEAPSIDDEITATVTFRICGIRESADKNEYGNSIDAELVAVEGASDKGSTKVDVTADPTPDSSTAVDEYAA